MVPPLPATAAERVLELRTVALPLVIRAVVLYGVDLRARLRAAQVEVPVRPAREPLARVGARTEVQVVSLFAALENRRVRARARPQALHIGGRQVVPTVTTPC